MDLKKYLLINSSFSFLTGMIMLILNPKLRVFFSVTEPLIFTIIGINLLIFAAFVLFVARSKPLKSNLVKIIVVLDILWVIGSFILIFTDVFKLSLSANITIGLVGVFIAFLAYKQYTNLQKVMAFKRNDPIVNS